MSSTDNITNDSNIYFDWTAASDSHSGVAGYYWSVVDSTPDTDDNWIAALPPFCHRRARFKPFVAAKDIAGQPEAISCFVHVDRAAQPPT
jgi:hypothetical protein